MRSRRARGGREEKELGLRGSTAEVMDERVGSVRNLKKKQLLWSRMQEEKKKDQLLVPAASARVFTFVSVFVCEYPPGEGAPTSRNGALQGQEVRRPTDSFQKKAKTAKKLK